MMDEKAACEELLSDGENSTVHLTSNKNGVETAIVEEHSMQPLVGHIATKLYFRRFFIMGIFCLYSMSSAFQWIEYAIITNIVLTYYKGVSELAVAWTSMIYMASYIPLMFVATWMLDNWGLRKSLLLGGTLNAVGALIKIGSIGQHLFYVSFIGQSIAACAQSFILEIPPKIASVWFGPSEVSTATAAGVFGNQLGVALGFLIPPMLVPAYHGNQTAEQDESVAQGLTVMFIGSAAVCCAVLLLIMFVISDEPPQPPSEARALASRIANHNSQTQSSSFSNYRRSINALMHDVPFVLLLVTYGVNTGVYYAIGTLLNPLLLHYNPGAEQAIGQIGLTMIVAGLGGSVLCGIFLDRTKLYKITTVGIYFLSMLFMLVFSGTLHLSQLWLDYITIGLLGFFMTGYLPIGFELAAEITFPESEATSSGLLNVSAQVFGILFTMTGEQLIKTYGVLAANLFMSGALLIGTIMTALIKTELKRQAANEQKLPENKTKRELIPHSTCDTQPAIKAGENTQDVVHRASKVSSYSSDVC